MREASAVAASQSGALVSAYYQLTKPGITRSVGMSAVAGYVVNAGGALDAATLIAVLGATMLMASGAAALNQVAERAADAQMRRTAARPLPAGLVTARAATTFGWLLTGAGALFALATLPMLVPLLLATCHVTYVYAYTPLKRASELCTLVGAVPGALPVLAGAAAAGAPGAAALALAALLFTWQITHFLAIGWLARDDYARAGFVMLPVVDRTGRRTARAALLYAIATQGLIVLLTREAALAPVLLSVVHMAGTVFWLVALHFFLKATKERARRLFVTSLLVLPLILGALLIDSLLRL